MAVIKSDLLAILYVGDMLWMQNISLQLQGNPFSLGLPCIPSDCLSFPNSLIRSQSKGRDIIFHLSEKRSADEVTFAFKVFSSGKSLIQSGSENDLIKSCLIKLKGTIPFVAKLLRGKIFIKSGLDFEDYNRTL